jgi:hypothetical protein
MSIVGTYGTKIPTMTNSSPTSNPKSESFLESVPTIIVFLLISLSISMLFGETSLYYFLIVLLLGMLILNSDKVKNKIDLLTGK